MKNTNLNPSIIKIPKSTPKIIPKIYGNNSYTNGINSLFSIGLKLTNSLRPS